MFSAQDSVPLVCVSYIPKKKRVVRLLSSQFIDDSIDDGEKKKPLLILEYNRTKGGVDTVDKMIREYSCSRKTHRWPMRLFTNMLDLAALNSYIIFTEKIWTVQIKEDDVFTVQEISIENIKIFASLASDIYVKFIRNHNSSVLKIVLTMIRNGFFVLVLICEFK